jgi:hypothetical protein
VKCFFITGGTSLMKPGEPRQGPGHICIPLSTYQVLGTRLQSCHVDGRSIQAEPLERSLRGLLKGGSKQIGNVGLTLQP